MESVLSNFGPQLTIYSTKSVICWQLLASGPPHARLVDHGGVAKATHRDIVSVCHLEEAVWNCCFYGNHIMIIIPPIKANFAKFVNIALKKHGFGGTRAHFVAICEPTEKQSFRTQMSPSTPAPIGDWLGSKNLFR